MRIWSKSLSLRVLQASCFALATFFPALLLATVLTILTIPFADEQGDLGVAILCVLFACVTVIASFVLLLWKAVIGDSPIRTVALILFVVVQFLGVSVVMNQHSGIWHVFGGLLLVPGIALVSVYGWELGIVFAIPANAAVWFFAIHWFGPQQEC